MQTTRIKKEKVEEVLVKTNRNLSDLARKLKMSPSYLTKLLSNERSPSPRIRRGLMKALDVTEWDELFEIKD